MTVLEHTYPIPTDEELAQLVGAATPHFALQAHHRIGTLAASLPDTHPRQAALRTALARLERIAASGEDGGESAPNMPPRPSLVIGD